MFSDSITIYNYFRDAKNGIDVAYYKTQISGVMWSEKVETTFSSSKIITADKVVWITIPTSKMSCDKEYLAYAQWQDSDDKDSYWTVNPSGQDVVAKGALDAELSSTYTLSKLKADYGDAVTVISFADYTNRNGLKHYKVGGR